MHLDQNELILSKTKWLHRALWAGFAMLALAAGCSQEPVPPTDNPVNVGAPFPQDGTGAATSGVVTSSSFRMSFSLGGTVPSMTGTNYQINSFSNDDKQP